MLWLYRPAFDLDFFNDDPTGHFAWMEGRTIGEFFTSSANYGYYRPIVFSLLRIMEQAFGDVTWPHPPLADHALLILLHAANAMLVWSLGFRLGGRSLPFAWVAALVFAATPFHYEAVAYVASLTHPLHVFWVLSALLLFDRGRVSGRSLWLMLSGVAQILGLLSHENGLFIFPAMIGLDLVLRPDEALGRRARALWPYSIPPILYVALWLTIPKNSDQGLNTIGDSARNLIPFLQTTIYPLLAWLRLDNASTGKLALLAVGFIGLMGYLARISGAMRVWLFALAWVGLAVLPSLFFLNPAYLYGSPRLSYLPSVGVALLWALPALWFDRVVRRKGQGASRLNEPAAVLLTALYSIILILPALPFIRCQIGFYEETSRIARGMAAAATVTPADEAIVFVNLPFFFSSSENQPDGCPNPYPWTTTGGILMPPYAQTRDFVRFNGGPDRPSIGVSFPGFAPGWRTFGPEISSDRLRDAVSEDAVFAFDLLSGDMIDLPSSWQPGKSAATELVTFGEALALNDVRLAVNRDRFDIHLDWTVQNPAAMPLSALVHVYDAGGALVAQADGPPGKALIPQSLWQTGDGLSDSRTIDLSTLPGGEYQVAVGVYSAIDGVRLPAIDSSGVRLPGDIVIAGSFRR